MTAGSRPGTTFPLDVARENRIGRDTDGAVVLTDALCSRVHAIVEHSGQGWQIRDAASRNGTYVNGQKIDDALLADGHVVRVGHTEFSFHCSQPLGQAA